MIDSILYIAFGKKHIAESLRAITRTNTVWPEVRVIRHESSDIKQPVMANRILFLSSYSATNDTGKLLYLDTDTYLVEPVPELFDLLDHFDIAVAHAPWRETNPVGLAPCFPEFNCGVIAFRCNDDTRQFFAMWHDEFMRDYNNGAYKKIVGFFPSQPSFRKTLYYSNLRIATLPPEYNWRGIGYAHGKIKILHTRTSFLEVNKYVNATTEPRVFGG